MSPTDSYKLLCDENEKHVLTPARIFDGGWKLAYKQFAKMRKGSWVSP